MGDRVATIAPIAAVGSALGLCCGLPVLLSLGVLGAVAGVSVQRWALIGLGLVLAALGWARWVRRRRSTEPSCHVGGLRAPQDPAPDQSFGTTTGNHP